ncbi:MAG: S-adenosylmethionine decarboxylase [Candidatus Aenigmarchaeota archaeon]|nr:S-adenosylmethionine decarboxylase [Candidatus Aenigmarchaeota archaeon]
MNVKHLAARLEGCKRDLINDERLSFGSHLTLWASLQGCDSSKLQDEELLTLTLLSSVFEGHMKLYKFFIHKFGKGGAGITVGGIIGSSHIITSTYPELGSLTINISSCKGNVLNSLYMFIQTFKPRKYELTVLPPFLTIASINSKTILREEDIADPKLVRWCKERKILPLLTTSEKFLSLLNILGFIFGDGHLKKNLNTIQIYQKDRNVLETIGRRLTDLNIKFRITSRESQSDHEVFELMTCDSNFCKLLCLLGAPNGSKTQQKLEIPNWLKSLDPSLKAMFLSSLFLSEFYKPKIYAGKPAYCKFEMVTSVPYQQAFISFLNDIRSMTKELYMKSNGISLAETYESKGKKMIKYAINFSATKDNFLRIQGLISLSKIYPLSLFNFDFKLNKQKPLHQRNSRYQDIIKYLMKHKNVSTANITSGVGLSKQNTSKWLKRLEERGIVINNHEAHKRRGPNKWELNI